MNQNIKETRIMRMYIRKNVENVTQIKIRITECKNPRKHHVYEKGYIWNPSTCIYENDKYLENTSNYVR